MIITLITQKIDIQTPEDLIELIKQVKNIEQSVQSLQPPKFVSDFHSNWLHDIIHHS